MSDVVSIAVTVGILITYPTIGTIVGGFAYAFFKTEDGASHDGASVAAALIAIVWPAMVTMAGLYFICARPIRALTKVGIATFHRFRHSPIPKAKVIR